MSRPLRLALCIGLLAALAPLAGAPPLQTPGSGENAARRMADRLAALRSEAQALAAERGTVLTELRRLEVERQIKGEELAGLEAELTAARERVAATTARAETLRQTAVDRQPDVEDRLVRLYKMGRAGYWRMLLDVNDLRAMGRAYRTASAMVRLDRERIEAHQRTLEAVAGEVAALQTRTRELEDLQSRAAAARRALDRTVIERAALVRSIESRQELAAELAAELDAAYLKLQSRLAQQPGSGETVPVPLRPFRAALPWPAHGIVISRFGAERAARVPGIQFNRNGIEVSLAEGSLVAAVHDGVVTHAGPFAGMGGLVIVDHGGGATSLYGHLGAISVRTGDRVGAGTNVGTSGRNTSGNPTLYFELRVDGAPVDPLQWLRRP